MSWWQREKMENLFDLTSKTAVVTGAGGVLCGEMAKSLAKAGAKVAVLDLMEDAAKRVADEINKSGGKAIAVKCSVLEKKQLEEARDTIAGKFGGIDILINGAGGNKKRRRHRIRCRFLIYRWKQYAEFSI